MMATQLPLLLQVDPLRFGEGQRGGIYVRKFNFEFKLNRASLFRSHLLEGSATFNFVFIRRVSKELGRTRAE